METTSLETKFTEMNISKKEDITIDDCDYHVMIDLETLGLHSNSIMASIGVRKFNIKTGKHVGEPFYHRIDLQSCQDLGFIIDISTLMWWTDPSRDAKSRDEIFGKENRMHIKIMIWKLIEYLIDGKCKYIWSKDPDFDCVILKSYFEKLGFEVPWKYYNQRSVRTITHIAKLCNPNAKCEKYFPANHHALDDCDSQIKDVVEAMRILNSNNK
jgi:exodeoxyribonuclease VIII